MSADAADKARLVRMVVLDVDGVMTDGRAYYMDGGAQALAFSVQDGTGTKYLLRCGIRVALLTGREVDAVLHRAKTLGIEDVVRGAKVKLDGYEAILARSGLADEQVAYMGDDLPDIPAMRRAGLAVAVPDAAPEVLECADLVTAHAGGRGAVRELAEFILKAQGRWQDVMARYLSPEARGQT